MKGIGVDYGLSEIQMREHGRVGSYYQRIENENEKIIGKIKVFFWLNMKNMGLCLFIPLLGRQLFTLAEVRSAYYFCVRQ